MKTAKFIELLKGRSAGGTGNTHTQTRPHSLIGFLESLALGMALSSVLGNVPIFIVYSTHTDGNTSQAHRRCKANEMVVLQIKIPGRSSRRFKKRPEMCLSCKSSS